MENRRLTDKEVYQLNYITNQIGKRILPYYFSSKNFEKMCQWQNQICLQTHVTIANFLQQMFPNSEITVWEGIFYDSMLGHNYNHSWVYMTRTIKGQTESYLCDVARISSHIGFVKSTLNNPSDFIKDQENVSKRKLIHFKKVMQEDEFYTGEPGSKILSFVIATLIKSRLL